MNTLTRTHCLHVCLKLCQGLNYNVNIYIPEKFSNIKQTFDEKILNIQTKELIFPSQSVHGIKAVLPERLQSLTVHVLINDDVNFLCIYCLNSVFNCQMIIHVHTKNTTNYIQGITVLFVTVYNYAIILHCFNGHGIYTHYVNHCDVIFTNQF